MKDFLKYVLKLFKINNWDLGFPFLQTWQIGIWMNDRLYYTTHYGVTRVIQITNNDALSKVAKQSK